MTTAFPARAAMRRSAPLRLGFLGVGWIGLDRMKALARSGLVEIAAVVDPDEKMLAAARAEAAEAEAMSTFEELLAAGLDGVVIATPSALHAQQTIAALDAGLAVFCQKPLGRTAAEAEAAVTAASRADRLLGVDLCYRHTAAMARIRNLIRSGELGTVFAADLTFHNAYGPDKTWFRDPVLSGGGCLIDLGIHLVDLALWTLDFPAVVHVNGRLYSGGRPLEPAGSAVEDYATATMLLETGTEIRIACSWNLHAGQDAEISAVFHGQAGGAAFRNVAGSFYDFTAERFSGTTRATIVTPPDAWGGRAAVAWAAGLANGNGFDPKASDYIKVARVLDGIYGNKP